MAKYVQHPERFPSTYRGVQINVCRNPRCENYGVPPLSEIPRSRKGVARDHFHDGYHRSSNGDGVVTIKCLKCKENPYAKSNIAVVEEVDRLTASLRDNAGCCPNAGCENYTKPISDHPLAYSRDGMTGAGSQRYRCKGKGCFRRFVPEGQDCAEGRQTRPELNYFIFKALANKMPMRGIMDMFSVCGIDAGNLYRRIDYFYRQCQRFSARHERQLYHGAPRSAMQVQIDRQVYVLNWPASGVKRNISFEAVGAAEGQSEFILAMNLNYDPSLDADAINADAEEIGDLKLQHCYRQYARVWLEADFNDPLRAKRRIRKHALTKRGGGKRATIAEIDSAYEDALARADIEESFVPDPMTEQTPRKGMQVHSEYTLYGTLYALERMTRGAERVTLYMDQESGIRAAALLAFRGRILDRSADAFYVRSNFSLTVPEREAMMAEKGLALAEARGQNPGLSDKEVRMAMVGERRATMTEHGRWGDMWMEHPLPTRGEPEKSVCWLTSLVGYSEDQINELYLDASLSSIDRFFMLVRRKLSMMERPIDTKANYQDKAWHGYAPYNPEMCVKLLAIFRTYFNYTFITKTGETPAQRLGIVDRAYSVTDLLGADPEVNISFDAAA